MCIRIYSIIKDLHARNPMTVCILSRDSLTILIANMAIPFRFDELANWPNESEVVLSTRRYFPEITMINPYPVKNVQVRRGRTTRQQLVPVVIVGQWGFHAVINSIGTQVLARNI